MSWRDADPRAAEARPTTPALDFTQDELDDLPHVAAMLRRDNKPATAQLVEKIAAALPALLAERARAGEDAARLARSRVGLTACPTCGEHGTPNTQHACPVGRYTTYPAAPPADPRIMAGLRTLNGGAESNDPGAWLDAALDAARAASPAEGQGDG